IGLPARAWRAGHSASRPTGAQSLTGMIRLAPSAKYTAAPPSSSRTLPYGPSRVSSAIDPTTSSSEGSGTPPSAAARGHDVSRVAQLLQEFLRLRIVLHPHPAASKLVRRMGVRSGRRNLAQVLGETRRRLVRARV